MNKEKLYATNVFMRISISESVSDRIREITHDSVRGMASGTVQTFIYADVYSVVRSDIYPFAMNTVMKLVNEMNEIR